MKKEAIIRKREVLDSYGGNLRLIKDIDDIDTTSIIRRIVNRYSGGINETS